VSDELAPVDPRGPEVAADWDDLESPEEYLGSRRAQNYDPSERSAWGEHRPDEGTRQLRRNHWTVMGNWTMTPEAVVLNEPNGRITFRFHARDVHLVMGPNDRAMPVPFRSRSTERHPAPRAGPTSPTTAPGCSTNNGCTS
jgi:Thioredoxin like C-terminal domain